MDSSRTTQSGQGLTLITGMGGRPVDRAEVETWCRTRTTTCPHDVAPASGSFRAPRLAAV